MAERRTTRIGRSLPDAVARNRPTRDSQFSTKQTFKARSSEYPTYILAQVSYSSRPKLLWCLRFLVTLLIISHRIYVVRRCFTHRHIADFSFLAEVKTFSSKPPRAPQNFMQFRWDP